MKYIIINEANQEKIMKAFQEEQGKSRERIIESIDQLLKITEEVENRLRITKKSQEGTEVIYTFKQHFPRTYKYTPKSTHFNLLYKSGKWRIDLHSISRETCPNKITPYEYNIILSETAKEEILKRYE